MQPPPIGEPNEIPVGLVVPGVDGALNLHHPTDYQAPGPESIPAAVVEAGVPPALACDAVAH